jgi:hypothetical protein
VQAADDAEQTNARLMPQRPHAARDRFADLLTPPHWAKPRDQAHVTVWLLGAFVADIVVGLRTLLNGLVRDIGPVKREQIVVFSGQEHAERPKTFRFRASSDHPFEPNNVADSKLWLIHMHLPRSKRSSRPTRPHGPNDNALDVTVARLRGPTSFCIDRPTGLI